MKPQALSAFFRRHTGSTSYLIAVSKAAHRFDLDGQPAGEISAEHREAAVEELARRILDLRDLPPSLLVVGARDVVLEVRHQVAEVVFLGRADSAPSMGSEELLRAVTADKPGV